MAIIAAVFSPRMAALLLIRLHVFVWFLSQILICILTALQQYNFQSLLIIIEWNSSLLPIISNLFLFKVSGYWSTGWFFDGLRDPYLEYIVSLSNLVHVITSTLCIRPTYWP